MNVKAGQTWKDRDGDIWTFRRGKDGGEMTGKQHLVRLSSDAGAPMEMHTRGVQRPLKAGR